MRSSLLPALALVLATSACTPRGQGFAPAEPNPGPAAAAKGPPVSLPPAEAPQASPASPASAAAAPAPAPAVSQVAAAPTACEAEARQFYAQRCSLCHGVGGKGDGVAAQNLRPRPRSFLEPGWQEATTDADIALIIVRGGSAVGKSMMMPASTDLAGRPAVVDALVAVVRSFHAR